MPRPAKPVKSKSTLLGHSLGAVDLHFHGAFGIDLMTASEKELNELCLTLWKNGVAAFCPTTLSASPEELKASVARLGNWIQKRKQTQKKSRSAQEKNPGAQPLGIHLEGPFLSPHACGAHHPDVIRKLDFRELEDLWAASQKNIRILTLAPETLTAPELNALKNWAKEKKIRLSLGHSRCTEKQALHAFKNGFSGITHAWNALAYHHRDSGAIGAAFSLNQKHQLKQTPILELIIDQVHVEAPWLQMTLQLFPKNTAFVSDCAPAAGLQSSKWCNFGNLKCRMDQGAARLANGTLAGSAILLPHAFARFLQAQVNDLSFAETRRLWKKQVICLQTIPLKAIGLSPRKIAHQKLEWRINAHRQVSFAWK